MWPRQFAVFCGQEAATARDQALADTLASNERRATTLVHTVTGNRISPLVLLDLDRALPIDHPIGDAGHLVSSDTKAIARGTLLRGRAILADVNIETRIIGVLEPILVVANFVVHGAAHGPIPIVDLNANATESFAPINTDGLLGTAGYVVLRTGPEDGDVVSAPDTWTL